MEDQEIYINELRKYADALKLKLGRPLYYNVVTFGCQMNAHDSEKLRGILERAGYIEGNTEEEDVVIYNTCTVRENANNRLYGHIGRLRSAKEKNPHMIIGICGCMMQEKDEVEKIQKKYPYVDMIFGTHNLTHFAGIMVEKTGHTGTLVTLLTDDNSKVIENVPSKRKYPFKSGVNIMYGCNNFCTYCIVPYVRGREYSRPKEEILEEIKRLIDDGVVEVMLLGQNVNSYGKTFHPSVPFHELLWDVTKINGIERIRFMTSHPKDLSDDLIDVMAASPKICPHLHLPLQSGSTRILKKMNRHYTKESYLELAEKIIKKIPDISLTTDIMVGFPSEAEEDFQDTMDVCREIGFDSAFTFIYSKRHGTPAEKMEDQVPQPVVKERFDRLLKLVQEKAGEKAYLLEGKTEKVLVEMKNNDPSLVTGRLPNNSVVHFRGNEDLIGKIVDVRLVECKGFYYMGERV